MELLSSLLFLHWRCICCWQIQAKLSELLTCPGRFLKTLRKLAPTIGLKAFVSSDQTQLARTAKMVVGTELLKKAMQILRATPGLLHACKCAYVAHESHCDFCLDIAHYCSEQHEMKEGRERELNEASLHVSWPLLCQCSACLSDVTVWPFMHTHTHVCVCVCSKMRTKFLFSKEGRKFCGQRGGGELPDQ